MDRNETLAYLGGLLDGDGYLKIVKYRLQRGGWVYYEIQVGVQQLWPGEAVRLFARTFDGKMMKPMMRNGLRLIARCELHTRKAEAALHSLLPYLLVKRPQALLLKEFCRLKLRRKRVDRPFRAAAMELLRSQLITLHDGSSWEPAAVPEPVESRARAPPEWTRGETLAYLAGVMDSDGNFRIEKKSVRGMLAPHYRINIRASQVLPSAAIELLAHTFGGRVRTQKSNRPTYRDLAHWSLHDKSAANAINELLPYLVVKRREADLLLELRRRKSLGKQGLTEWIHRNRWQRPITMHKRCYTPEQVAEFERLRREVMALHSGEVVEPGIL